LTVELIQDARNTTLKILSIANNAFPPEGLRVILQALMVNRSITQLNMKENIFKPVASLERASLLTSLRSPCTGSRRAGRAAAREQHNYEAQSQQD
jgi:Ran GTPase-activating protein (RanGAP) involved in mRNA processing and transport